MITITRLQARQLRIIIRRALGLSANSRRETSVQFSQGAHGLQVSASCGGFAVRYEQPAALPDCVLTVPLSLLKQSEGSTAEPLTLAAGEADQINATWHERGIPQQAKAPALESSDVLIPPLPATLQENPPTLRQALAEASQSTYSQSPLYALGCVQLRGRLGDVSASDGHQVYRQSGFNFGSEDNLLLRCSDVFAAKELADADKILFGVTADHAMFVVGQWSFWLPLEKEGKYPNLDSVIPATKDSVVTLELSPDDAEFLIEHVPRLPGHDDPFRPVTLDLNGCVAIRGRECVNAPVTELRLSSSRRAGANFCISSDRRFVQRAAKLGFSRWAFFAPGHPIICRDEQRLYAWAPLSSEDVIKPRKDATLIESPRSPGHSSTSPPTQSTRRTTSMPARQKKPAAAAPPTATALPATEHPVTALPVTPTTDPTTSTSTELSVLDQAQAVRAALRETLGQVNNLLRAIQRQRKQERSLRSMLSSLRQLQQVA